MIRIFVAVLGEFVPESRDSYGYGAIGKFQWRGTEGRCSVRANEERVERGDWMV